MGWEHISIERPPSPQRGAPGLPDGYAGKDLRLYDQKFFPEANGLPKANPWTSIAKQLKAGCAAVARRLITGAASVRWLAAVKASPFVAGLVAFIWGPAVSIGANNEPMLDYHPQGIRLTEDEYNAIMAQIARSPGDRGLWEELGWRNRYVANVILARYSAGSVTPIPMWPQIDIPPVSYKLPGIQKGTAVLPGGDEKDQVLEPNPPDGPVYAPGAFADEVSDPKPERNSYILVDSDDKRPTERETAFRLQRALSLIESCRKTISSEGEDKFMEKLDPPFLNKLFGIIKDLEVLHLKSDYYEKVILDFYEQLNELADSILLQDGASEKLVRQFVAYAKGELRGGEQVDNSPDSI